MHRHEQIIQLADHVKKKLKQHQRRPASGSFINSSDEFVEINSTDDDDDGEDNDSVLLTSPHKVRRQRRDTFTTYEVKQSSASFFTDREPIENPAGSVLQTEYIKQHQCQECNRRDLLIQYDRQRLLRLSDENQKLSEQLRSSMRRNYKYEEDIEKLKHHLTTVHSHLHEYQQNFDQLKQRIVSEKKPSTPETENVEVAESDMTIDHLKRLRYEVEMYNRIVVAKQQQEEQKNERKPIDFFF